MNKQLYKYLYKSPIGNLVFISNGTYLNKIILENELDNNNYLIDNNLAIFKLCIKYFDLYFNHEIPNINIPYELEGTKFQKEIWSILKDIPYGQSMTYKDICNIYLKKNNVSRMSCQTIGHAIGKNPLLILIPCHRILGQNNKLTGFRVGLNIKKQLLNLENIKYQE